MLHLISLQIQKHTQHLSGQTEKLQGALKSFYEHLDSFRTECQASRQAYPDRAPATLPHIAVLSSALTAEMEGMQMVSSRVKALSRPAHVTPFGRTIVDLSAAVSLRLDRKRTVFSRITRQVDSPTLYWDLVFWLVVSSAYCEEALGDLAEEYVLRSEADGEAAAQVWYRDQTIRTVKDLVWKRVERLAAVGTLIDLVRKFFKG